MITGEHFRKITEDAARDWTPQDGSLSDRLDAIHRWRIDRQKMVAQLCAYVAQDMTPLLDEIEDYLDNVADNGKG